MESRYSERPRRQAVPHRHHSYVPTRLEFSSDSDDSDDRYRPPQARHQKQRPKPPRELKREPMRSRRELDYSDAETAEEEYFSDPSTAVPPRRRPGECLHKANRKPHSRQVVERKTTTRPSKQNDENDVKIRRKPMPKDKYTESRFMQSDGRDYSDAEYEEMGRHQQHRHHRHHFARGPHAKELQLSDESEQPKAYSRPRRRVVDSGNGRKRNVGAATQFKRL
uniref:Uncharacterized protein n=1 Tax=Mesocestoides corti TaxID=53468 RepID=A0A5K3FMH4_MESCO